MQNLLLTNQISSAGQLHLVHDVMSILRVRAHTLQRCSTRTSLLNRSGSACYTHSYTDSYYAHIPPLLVFIKSAAFSAIMTVAAYVLADTSLGITEASATLRFLKPFTLSCGSTTGTEPPTFHLIFSYYTLINSVLFKPFPYVHGYTLYHMHEKRWGWMLQNP